MRLGTTVGKRMGERGGRVQWVLAVAGAVTMLELTGCHHRRVQPVVLPPQTPVALIELPAPGAPALVEAQHPALPAVPTANTPEKPKRVKKRATKPTAAAQQPVTGPAGPTKKPADPGVTTTAVTAPAKPDTPVAVIGALTVGGEQSPRALQEANELITSNERRLNGLSADAVKAQAELVGKVRNFQKEAQMALASGDSEGAKTLATKGKLLLDDFDKAESK